MSRAISGAVAYRSGLAAETTVAAHYLQTGLDMAARRWRGACGEIDLILRDGAALVFVEVKRSRSFTRAAERLTPRQAARIMAAASEFLAGEPRGQDTDVRFDLALVNAAGEVCVMENVLAP